MILVVDDHQSLAKAIEFLLKAGGMDAQSISDPLLVVPSIENNLPRVLILDNHMPGLSGMEILRMIRSRPRLRTLPVVMLTADDSVDEETKAYALGVKDYYIKGKVEFKDLVARVRSLSDAERE
jgi:DNA-binding response OmpR family regulator